MAYAAKVDGAVVGCKVVPDLETSAVGWAIVDANTVAGWALMSAQRVALVGRQTWVAGHAVWTCREVAVDD